MEQSNSIYEHCSASYSNDVDVNRCLSDSMEKQLEILAFTTNVFFHIFAATLMFLMQAGFAMLCAGSVRRKNVQNTMLKNLLDACGAAVGFWSVGYAFAYGDDGQGGPVTFIGKKYFFMIGLEDYDIWLFQFAFAATSATIVAGTLAERCQMAAYICYSMALTGFVYPVIAHSIWSSNGFLSPYIPEPFLGSGMIDFAGAGVVHVTGGITALIASIILGPRKDRFLDPINQNPMKVHQKRIKGHSPSLQVLGTFILWFGWFGFNAGSVSNISSDSRAQIAALAAVNTALGGSAGCISALVTSAVISERRTGELVFDITDSLNGALSGLVSITAGCAIMHPWTAVVVGTIAGWIYLFSSELLVRVKIDDAVDAIPVHLANGTWGVISVCLFSSPKLLEKTYGSSVNAGLFFTGSGKLLAVNLLGLLFIVGWVACVMIPFFFILNYLGWFRADPLEELVGLDVSWHGATPTVSEYTSKDRDPDPEQNIKPEILELLEQRKRESIDNIE